MVYIKYIEYRKVHVSKRKIPRNRKVSGVFLLCGNIFSVIYSESVTQHFIGDIVTVHRQYPTRCFAMNIGKIPSPKVIWNGF